MLQRRFYGFVCAHVPPQCCEAADESQAQYGTGRQNAAPDEDSQIGSDAG